MALADDPGRHAAAGVGAEVPDAAAHPACHAEGGHDRRAGREERRLLRDLDEAVLAADPAGRAAGDDRLGLRSGDRGRQARASPAQRAVAHDRGAVGSPGPDQVDQRPRRRSRATTCRTFCRSTRRCTGRIRPEAWTGATRDRSFDTTPGRLRRPRADRDARARRRRGRRRERRLCRGLVPAGGRRHPVRLRHGGVLVRLLRGQSGGRIRSGVGSGLLDLPSTPTGSAHRRSGTTTTHSG